MVSLSFGLDAPAYSQWSLTQLFVPVVEDFSSFAAPSTWGTANPAADQLDSDIWAFSQTSSTNSTSSAFGLNYINGKGINTGGVSTAGIYAFDDGAGKRGIGPQADDSAWSPGNLTIKLQNDTGSEIEQLRVEWSYLLYNDQTGRRASQLLISSSDNSGSYLAPFGGEVATLDQPQTILSWLNIPRDVTFNTNIPVGEDYYLRWSFTDLTGFEGTGVDRDEIGITDLRITPIGILPGDFNASGAVNGLDFLAWQIDPSLGDLAAWEDNYGLPLSADSTTVPEPGSLVLALAGFSLGLARRSC